MRKFISMLILCFIAVSMTGCQNQYEEERLRMEAEQRQMEQSLVRQRLYASLMRFESHLLWNESTWIHFDRHPVDMEIIFVTSEEAATGFGLPLNIAIGWPSVFALGVMEEINNTEAEWSAILKEHELSFESFGLSMPLTVEDLVDNWTGLYDLLLFETALELRQAVFRQVGTDSLQARQEADIIRILLFPGYLNRLNRLLEGREMGEDDLALLNERRERSGRETVMMEDLPTFPITEEDIRNNPWLIRDTSMIMMTEEERQYPIFTPENLHRLFMEAQEGEQQ
ncbi:MAG: hypothetical protein FWE05_13790 [Defluviitaleaceae bacterium]|nr:hypothetical protein [Defluviitaleaceae bacterium]